MAIHSGCHEGKMTPRLMEILCPACGEVMEIFVNMGGSPGETGRTVSDETCPCGYVVQAGTPAEDLEEA